MRLRSAAAAILSGAVILSNSRAHACSPAQPYASIDPWSPVESDDVTPPSTAPVITGEAGYSNPNEGCGSTDCPAQGHVTITIEVSGEDEETPADRMGYRIEVIEGDALPAGPFIADRRWTRTGEIRLDGHGESFWSRIRVIPVDQAGNEGPASNTITVGYDETGCTATGLAATSTLGPALLVLVLAALRRRRLDCA